MTGPASAPAPPLLALTQGDPAGVGPEIALRVALEAAQRVALEAAQRVALEATQRVALEATQRVALEATQGPALEAPPSAPWTPLLVAERAALEALRPSLQIAAGDWARLRFLSAAPTRSALEALPAGVVPVFDPVGVDRRLELGVSGAADAAGALAALDAGAELARHGTVDALVTAPLSKHSIARHLKPDFRGHTDYLAAGCGLERYGRDYLMTFLSPDLRVALLSTHQPLAEAVASIDERSVGEALDCLAGQVQGRIVVAGLNPHAGEHGLMGGEDDAILRPAVAAARRRGIDAHGPESADSLFARTRQGEFDWVLALYHDQGLIAVKTAAFGTATNWTLGLPYLRTSVDHGTAFPLAGSGQVRVQPMREVVARTLELIAERQPAPR